LIRRELNRYTTEGAINGTISIQGSINNSKLVGLLINSFNRNDAREYRIIANRLVVYRKIALINYNRSTILGS
jgi:hypothetical protein